MAKDTEIVLNKVCKKLMVYNCEATINFHELEYRENLGIWPSINKGNNIKLVDLKRFNRIRFPDMYCSTNLITTLLTSIEIIRHVAFDHSIILIGIPFSNQCYDNLLLFIASKGYFNDNPGLLSKFLAMKDKKPKVFVVEMFSIMNDCILRNFLDKEMMDTVLTYEFERIAIDSDNCRLFRKLNELKIL